MGYFKQQLIADQEEVSERTPRPASSHIALMQNRNRFRIERERTKRQLADSREDIFTGFLLGGGLVGAAWLLTGVLL